LPRKVETLKEIPVDLIDEPEVLLHPYPDIAQLEELAKSIKEHQLIEPIVVRAKGDRYQIVTGYRRYLAHKKFGIPKVLARILPLDDKNSLLSTAVENIQRTDIDVIEEGKLYRQLIYEHGISLQEVASKLGKSTGYIESRIQLLGMPEDIQELCRERKLQLGVIPHLRKIEDDDEKVLVASDISRRGHTVETAKHLIESFLKYKKTMTEAKPEEVLEKAEEEPIVMCEWCRQERRLKLFRSLAICDDCFRFLMYLYERERLSKRE